MEFSFGEHWLSGGGEAHAGNPPSESAPFSLGLHAAGRFDKVVDLAECWLQSPESARIVNEVRTYCRERGLDAYSTRTNEGYLRNLVIREGRRSGERMMNLVTYDDRPGIMQALTQRILSAVPDITTIVNNISTKKSQVAVGEWEKIYHGPGTIRERIGRRTYRISANSFFQTNTEQAERMYDAAMRLAQLRPTDVLYDLYSGTGTIALHLADNVREVVGIEAVESAVEDARNNARLNSVTNCTFLHGDLKETLVGAHSRGTALPLPDVVVVDPPRAGMHERVAMEIRRLHPRRIVYVSCNPATLARDLKILCDGGAYSIDEAQPVDMFPHTSHIESIVALGSSEAL
jgi:23S rRNA (uracil1939-C5)-methyltransferase